MKSSVRPGRAAEQFPIWTEGAIAVCPSQKVHDEQGLALVANLKNNQREQQ